MKRKAFVSLLLAALVAVPALTGCGGTSSEGSVSEGGVTDEAKRTFTYWIGQGDTNYNGYDVNPAINLTTNYMKWGTSQQKITVNFTVPPSGQASSNLVTMLGTGDYTDIIEAAQAPNGVRALYDEGIAMDLTPYVNKYMPNYKKWLASHPDYAKTATNDVNGEKKYIQLFSYHDTVDPVWGYQYRRDWVAKYGKNPTTGASFSGSYDANKVWSDDVIFPSGGKDPVYISDWEWMFPIFEEARKAEGISDGYDISLYYPGFFEPGDLVDAFGGHGPTFYNDDGTVKFGGTSDGFRTYLKAMNNWYNKGWLDKKFSEHSSDMYWTLDSSKVHSGKIGMWYGQQGCVGNLLDISGGKPNSAENGYTNGICVYGARQPINNTYGSDAEKNVTPYNFYATSLEYSSFIVTDKAKDKDLDVLFSWMDYFYSDAGALLSGAGLSKEEYELTKDPYYTKFGYTEGAWYYCDSNGEKWVEGTSTGDKLWRFVDGLVDDTNVKNALCGNRVANRQLGTNKQYLTWSPIYQHAMDEWKAYDAKGNFHGSLTSQISSEKALENANILTKVRDFMNTKTPDFISGAKDINADTAWNGYCATLKKYKFDTYVSNLQEVVDLFK